MKEPASSFRLKVSTQAAAFTELGRSKTRLSSEALFDEKGANGLKGFLRGSSGAEDFLMPGAAKLGICQAGTRAGRDKSRRPPDCLEESCWSSVHGGQGKGATTITCC